MENRWRIEGSSIVWDVKSSTLPHIDHLEMSGKKVSEYVEYGVTEEGKIHYSLKVIFPLLRMIPNVTTASLVEDYDAAVFPQILANGALVEPENVETVSFDSVLKLEGISGSLKVMRSFYPCHEEAAVIQKVCLCNTAEHAVELSVDPLEDIRYRRGVYGLYNLTVFSSFAGKRILAKDECLTFYVIYSGRKMLEQRAKIDGAFEEQVRMQFWKNTRQQLQLHTPDPLLNQAFDFAKLRASESVFRTKNGLLHSPGGLTYYAAVWANDQAEYAGPFFPWLGNEDCIEATLNCYRLYVPFMGPEYTPIPSSIISEGIDIWEGAGDRGDAAMYAYGASRFVLSLGKEKEARELWKPIAWCLEYCRRNRNEYGVVTSDTDELENRFPSGDANLCTSSLYYDALRSAASLGDELGFHDEAVQYRTQAEELHQAIESYFGARVSGFDTYRYYAGNDCLRSWLCIPLTMGIFDRKEETIRALFSEKLWTPEGLATQEGDEVVWDRSTLYGLRGVMYAGESDRALDFLRKYTQCRVLGEHVPYPIEACAKANRQGLERQLAAESALYCRIYTEGLFGMTPVGLKTFTCQPCLPAQWDEASLCDIHAFDTVFSLAVKRENDQYHILVQNQNGKQEFSCRSGEKVTISL